LPNVTSILVITADMNMLMVAKAHTLDYSFYALYVKLLDKLAAEQRDLHSEELQ
jgi:hypothetical protein